MSASKMITSLKSRSPSLLPFRVPTPATPELKGSPKNCSAARSCAPCILDDISHLCAENHTGVFDFLLAAWYSVLRRYNEQRDLEFAAYDGTRSAAAGEKKEHGIDFTLHPIIHADLDTRFSSLVPIIKRAVDKAWEQKQNPQDDEPLGISHPDSTGRSSTTVYFGYIDEHGLFDRTSCSKSGSTASRWTEDAPYELAMEATRQGTGDLNIRLKYHRDYYEAEDMDRFLQNYIVFLSSATANFMDSICDLAMCGETELLRLRSEFWNTKVTENHWGRLLFIDKFLRTAENMPDVIALEDQRGATWSYSHLKSRAYYIRSALEQQGVEPGQLVGILCEPSPDCVAAVLGILLARCGYVPMEPDSPIDRLVLMTNDSGLRHVLVGRSCASVATAVCTSSGASIKLISAEEPSNTPYESKFDKSSILPLAQDPFYLIYTSGTTGQPKGILTNQANVQQLLSNFCHDFDLSPGDKFLWQTSLCFDMSIMQTFPALAVGATICIADKNLRKDPNQLAEFMSRTSTTVTYFTPTHFSVLLETGIEALRSCLQYRLAFFGGERLPPELAAAFHALKTPARAFNGWGPSEMTVHCTMQEITNLNSDEGDIPIGYPFANCHIYIVDSKLNPVPVGVAGEICLAGPQTVKGYLGRADETQKKFATNPFASDADRDRDWSTLHRSGDKGCFLKSGNLAFRGRMSGDSQIKLRGFRIDLREVERVLLNASDFTAVAVIARDPAQKSPSLTDNRQIIAFLVPKALSNKENLQQRINQLHSAAKMQLNEYMLPSGYQIIENLPVTIGDKLDVQHLHRQPLQLLYPSSWPREALTGLRLKKSSTDFSVDPELVSKISGLFRTILSIPESTCIPETANFFDLGGQSIQLVRLQGRIKGITKVKVPLPVLFQDASPFAVAQQVQNLLQPTSEVKSADFPTRGIIDWNYEATLPDDLRYSVSAGVSRIPRSQTKTILLTGPESFAGIHVLSQLLSESPGTEIHLLGSQSRISIADIEVLLQRYSLLGQARKHGDLYTRLRPVNGHLADPHFGLDKHHFNELGASLNTIYHLGTEVSILKSYFELKNVNVRGTLDIIELAGLGHNLTEIHFGSTQSVCHLQTWAETQRTRDIVVRVEETIEHFFPAGTSEHGYFKARWVAEMLVTQAAQRGFAVSIYRFSAVTASTVTGVPNPATDLVPLMARQMLTHRCVPEFPAELPPFALDFVPVNKMASALHGLSSRDAPFGFVTEHSTTSTTPAIYHICNPNPLTLQDLVKEIEAKFPGSKGDVRVVPKGQWVAAVTDKDNVDADLGLKALQGYFDLGHVMFSLDGTRTLESLQAVGCDALATCPPVGIEYLREMIAKTSF